MHYSKNYKRMVIGTCNGILAILPIEAEKMDMGEEEEDENNEKTKQVLTDPLNLLGRYHVEKITGVRELGKSTQLVTISNDETIAIWEATTGQQLSLKDCFSQQTALDTSADGKAVFVGSAMGMFRAYDVTNRKDPRLVRQLKLFNEGEKEPVTSIASSSDGIVLVVASNKSNKVWFMSQKASSAFEIFGFANANGYVVSVSFATFEGTMYVLCVLNNGICQAFKCPREPKKDKLKAYTDEEVRATVRKLDPGTEIVISTDSP